MYCQECGKENKDNSNFCEHCGRTFSGIQPDIATKSKKKGILVSVTVLLIMSTLIGGGYALFSSMSKPGVSDAQKALQASVDAVFGQGNVLVTSVEKKDGQMSVVNGVKNYTFNMQAQGRVEKDFEKPTGRVQQRWAGGLFNLHYVTTAVEYAQWQKGDFMLCYGNVYFEKTERSWNPKVGCKWIPAPNPMKTHSLEPVEPPTVWRKPGETAAEEQGQPQAAQQKPTAAAKRRTARPPSGMVTPRQTAPAPAGQTSQQPRGNGGF